MTQFWIFGDSLKFYQRPNFLYISWKPFYAASWFFWKLSQYLQKQNTFFAASCRRDFLKSIFEGLSRQSAAGESLNLFHELYFFFVFGKIQLILSCRWRRGWTESQVENLKNLAANRQKIFQIITKYFQNNSNYHKKVSKYIEISWSGEHKQTGGKKAKTYFPNITKYFQFRT